MKGDLLLINIGLDYYMTRFTSREDYEQVLMDDPWMIGDNYLFLR